VLNSAKETGRKIIGIKSYLNSNLAKISDVALFSSTYDLEDYTVWSDFHRIQLPNFMFNLFTNIIYYDQF
jgi:DNA-binding MurR/RpiR family transcriptional regulator